MELKKIQIYWCWNEKLSLITLVLAFDILRLAKLHVDLEAGWIESILIDLMKIAKNTTTSTMNMSQHFLQWVHMLQKSV